MGAALRLATLLAAAALLCGCAGRYFQAAGAPPAVPAYTLASLPYKEYWTGIVFNGAKVGFSRFRIEAGPRESGYQLHSEAVIRIRFLGLDKNIRLKSEETVREDLSLARFRHDNHIDGSDLEIEGELQGPNLALTVRSGGNTTRREISVSERLYPASAIVLYPALAGLRVGAEHRYQIFSGELQKPAEVNQRVEGYERSALFDGAAFKVVTELSGLKTSTWIDDQARPVFELGLHGVMISALEPEAKARSYLASAALNQDEAIVDWSLIRTDAPIAEPRRSSYLKIGLSGGEARRAPISDLRQQCGLESGAWVCEIDIDRVAREIEHDAARFLAPSTTVASLDTAIVGLARKLRAASDAETVASILDWMGANIRKEPLDVFSARDVLDKGRAECQGHSYLFAALARASGIATRVVNGLVYSEDHRGFLFHTWVESFVEGRWQAIDPTFGQARADATHLALVHGESMEDLLPILDWAGRTRARVLAVRH